MSYLLEKNEISGMGTCPRFDSGSCHHFFFADSRFLRASETLLSSSNLALTLASSFSCSLEEFCAVSSLNRTRVRTLHRYLLRQIIITLLMTAAVFTLVLLLGSFLREVLPLMISQKVS